MENQGNENKIKVMIVNWIGLPEAERKKKGKLNAKLSGKFSFKNKSRNILVTDRHMLHPKTSQ